MKLHFIHLNSYNGPLTPPRLPCECGLSIHPTHTVVDPADVTCGRCKKTHTFKRAEALMEARLRGRTGKLAVVMG